MSHQHGAHTHEHGPAAEDYAARAHPEYVVLDIGGGLGALIVQTGAEMHGIEIEISRRGEARTGAHKQVLERGTPDRPAFTAVFDKLPEGSYTLWLGDEALADEVAVSAGDVAELDWRAG
jgi:hypothetical protein